jgi:DNA processing protein
LLRLKLAPGLGPILIDRVLERYGSGAAAVKAIESHGAAALSGLERLGAETARKIARAMVATAEAAEEEIGALEDLGASLIGLGDAAYPALLRDIPGAPVTLSVRGTLDAERDRFGVAIVGSRKCTAYGAEQAARFAAGLGSAGLTIVSGGARGIDTHAHAAALRAGARTVVVLGCGLGHCYPPENRGLFQDVVESGGAVVSELPARSAPESKNFPARNRIISGLSLGVLVVEAGRRSGALITARQAVEEQGREVLTVPGRVDSAASEGCHELLKQGAALATSPADVLETLEGPARHAHGATFGARYTAAAGGAVEVEAKAALLTDLNETQRAICESLTEPRTLDELARGTGLTAEVLRSETTMLELRRVLVRDGARLRVRGAR